MRGREWAVIGGGPFLVVFVAVKSPLILNIFIIAHNNLRYPMPPKFLINISTLQVMYKYSLI